MLPKFDDAKKLNGSEEWHSKKTLELIDELEVSLNEPRSEEAIFNKIVEVGESFASDGYNRNLPVEDSSLSLSDDMSHNLPRHHSTTEHL